jgi:hypothetical protein
MTFREVWLRYQTVLLESWDHTAYLATVMCNTGGGSKKKLSFFEAHPFRSETKTQALQITPENIGMLKSLFSQ